MSRVFVVAAGLVCLAALWGCIGCAPDLLVDRRQSTNAACDNVTDADGLAPGQECNAPSICAAHCCNCSADGPSQRAAFCTEEGICADSAATCARLAAAGALCDAAAE